MIVVICGQHRSGSTLAWQIARELLGTTRSVSTPLRTPSRFLRLHALRPRHVRMVKVHFSPSLRKKDFPQWGAKYIYTYRDPRDVVASLIRKGRYGIGDPRRGPQGVRAMARRELWGDKFWRTRKTLWVGKYEEISQDIPALVLSLASFLDVDIDEVEVERITDFVSIERQRTRVNNVRSSGVDPDLRITSHHITDGSQGSWRKTLTPEEVTEVQSLAGAWMASHGYLCEQPPRSP